MSDSNRNTILRWVASFRNTGSTLKKKSPGRNSIALRLSEATVRSRALRLLSLGPFEGNPRELHEKPLHNDRVTVWCGVARVRIPGPYFFEEAGATVTVNSQRYTFMINNFLAPRLNALQIDQVWFQQDGATSHTAQISLQVLRQMFPGRLMSSRYNLSIFEELDISQKINKYTRAMGIINSVMKPSLVQKHTRIRLYNTLARPMLSYGSEAWTLRKADKNRKSRNEIHAKNSGLY
ncbi:hypothetical protein ANN_20642 [Periplaneta americana]|uniref:Transposase n=1 Tax=Periplaneta americana TaxID=6978 RepID=A0ABQ8SD54_PERAM|nr:hypothetical protein ANN_20642 [Periplaneta americana]